MDLATIVLWSMLLIPLFSLLFLNHYDLKRFSGVGILASLIVSLVHEAANTYNWFSIGKKLFEWNQVTGVAITFGLFLAGTIWIFYFTFDRPLWVYFFVNALVDGFYIFVARGFLKNLGIIKTGVLDPIHIFMLMYSTAIIIYLYQRWVDTVMIKTTNELNT